MTNSVIRKYRNLFFRQIFGRIVRHFIKTHCLNAVAQCSLNSFTNDAKKSRQCYWLELTCQRYEG